MCLVPANASSRSVEGTQPVATLGRRYHFSASHRLHSDCYDGPTNQAIFGKCNNPHGHGHNYTVELLFRGPVDPTTGMVADLAALDRFAADQLYARFDHQNLNTLLCFASCVPSTENLTLELYRIFRQFRGAQLHSVHVQETQNNSFTYDGEPAATKKTLNETAITPESGTDLVTGETPHSGVL